MIEATLKNTSEKLVTFTVTVKETQLEFNARPENLIEKDGKVSFEGCGVKLDLNIPVAGVAVIKTSKLETKV
jgi:hypothetical protein